MEFCTICSFIPLTLSTPQFAFQSAIALFCVNLRNIGAMLYLKSHNLENTGIPLYFLENPKTDYKLFQMVKIYPSMSWGIFGNVFKLIRHNLENTESSAEHSAEYFQKS